MRPAAPLHIRVAAPSEVVALTARHLPLRLPILSRNLPLFATDSPETRQLNDSCQISLVVERLLPALLDQRVEQLG